MRVLIVNPYPIHRAAVGGVTRVYELVRYLAPRHRVTVLAHASADKVLDERAVAELAEIGVDQRLVAKPSPGLARRSLWVFGGEPYFVHRNRNPGLEDEVTRLSLDAGVDVVHIEFLYLAPLLRRLGPRTAKVLAEQEVVSLVADRLSRVPFARKSIYELFLQIERAKIETFERSALAEIDKIYGITEAEAQTMALRSGRRVEVRPHIVRVGAFRVPEAEPTDLNVLFVGNYDHRPNVHALGWFVERVWPIVRRAVPSARFDVVGPSLKPRVAEALSRQGGIRIVGRVDDLAGYYRATSVFVNPIQSGGGMRGKVLEAFASGRPVVSTPLGMEGIAATSETNCLVADGEEDFARSVVRYLMGPSLRRRHGLAARKFVERQYDSSVVFAGLESDYEAAVAERRGAVIAEGGCSPQLSIQIVTWNSASVIEPCLRSLKEQTSSEFELVVVDNASGDGSAAKISNFFSGRRDQTFPVRLIHERVNSGFCAGQNRALATSVGDWILFLNPDATLPSDFVERALSIISDVPPEVGTIAPSIRLPEGSMDSAGLYLDRLRRAYDRGRGETPDGYLEEEDVFGATGAVALHRRTMLEDVAIDGCALDNNLFAYYDDVDLAWRARLRGWRCRFVPSLTAIHERAARNALRTLSSRPTSAMEQALTIRNRLLVMAKCEPLGSLVGSLPRFILFETARVLFMALTAPRALRGYPEAISGLPDALRARKRIRSRGRRFAEVGGSR